MANTVAVTSWKYNATSRHLKIFYSDGSGELYHPVPEFIMTTYYDQQTKLLLYINI